MKMLHGVHNAIATLARSRQWRSTAGSGDESVAGLTPGLGPLPSVPVTRGGVPATDPALVIARVVARAWKLR